MPYVPHLRSTVYFDLGPYATPHEKASCTVNFRTPGPLSDGDMQVVVDDLFDDWNTFIADPNAEVGSNVTLREVKVWAIDTSNHVTGPTYISTHGPTGGGGSGVKHPYQDTLCVTLDAGGRGPGRFGRFYLPPQQYQIDADGLVAAADHTNIWTAVQTLCANLSNKPGIDVGFGMVVSGRTGVAGTLRDVTSIRLGRVVDTQRRRRRSLNETYSVASFTP